MANNILSPHYWKTRLEDAEKNPANLHHAVYRCPLSTWRAIEEQHKKILKSTLKPRDSILDCGCGWGRLLDLLPEIWEGFYLGIDLSPNFIVKAKKLYPTNRFMVGRLDSFTSSQELPLPYRQGDYKFDYAIMISIRPMIKRELGDNAWEAMESEIRKVADKLLYLEYDPDYKGSIE